MKNRGGKGQTDATIKLRKCHTHYCQTYTCGDDEMLKNDIALLQQALCYTIAIYIYI